MKRLLMIAPLWLPWAARAHTLTASPAEQGAEPWVLALLALAMVLYAIGNARLYARARQSRLTLMLQSAFFAAGWMALLAALASPLDAAGSRSFAAHMVQHELLMIVAAPLLVLGRPLGVWIWAWPAGARRGVGAATRGRRLRTAWHALTRPLNAWLLHFAALWLWHVPGFFQAALLHPGWHALQHASFLFPALLFWWAVLVDGGTSRSGALIYLFTTMLHTGALGALLALSSTIWYPAYGGAAMHYGLSALEDQQLGGLIMWGPGGLAYLLAALLLCAGWLAPQPQGKRT